MRSTSGSLSRRNLLSGKDPPLFCFVATHPKLSMLAPHLCPADSHDVGLCLARPTQDEHSCKQELAKTGSSPLQCDCWNQVCFESAAQVKCPRPDPPELVSATPVFLLVNAVLVCSRNPKLESMHVLSASALRPSNSATLATAHAHR